jgi:predicted negative regulator of RcsB-dependent stress response
LVNSIDPKTFEAGFAELRGDIYASMGRIVDARDAYIAAQEAGSNADGLRMKLDDLSDES